MTDYPFGMQLAVAPLNENNVIRDGEVWIYATTDTAGTSPLVLTDLTGLPMVNPLRSNAFGYTRPFVTTEPQVKWKSGVHEGLFDSFAGMRDEAIAAKLAAQAAVLEVMAAGGAAAAAAVAEVEEQLGETVDAVTASAAAATASSSAAAVSQAAALAAQASAEAAAATSSGGGFAISPTDPDVLIITTKLDGTIIVDPDDSDALIITT